MVQAGRWAVCASAFPAREQTRFISPGRFQTDHSGGYVYDWPVHDGVDISWDRNNSDSQSYFGYDVPEDFPFYRMYVPFTTEGAIVRRIERDGRIFCPPLAVPLPLQYGAPRQNPLEKRSGIRPRICPRPVSTTGGRFPAFPRH